ncbi:MAG: acyclic terpene utilization AtuA family protein [Gemmatales bacterium]
MRTSLRIGNGCGFWGDNVDAPLEIVRHGKLDYLTLEYLAELTMSILALLKQRDPTAGYAHDFLGVLKKLSPELHKQPHLKITTNAGGMNPRSCGEQARAILNAAGLGHLKIGVVTGDDLFPRLDELLAAGHPLTNLDTGKPLSDIRDKIVSANAYVGSQPIVEALAGGANIVITGRVADACLTVGPAIHEFGWKWDDWARLSAATVAGHLIECGAQATGGLWERWDQTPDFANVGYPIADFTPNGDFLITKPAGSGGAVNRQTVTAQLLYEVNNPAAYYTPDVVSDFTSINVEEVGQDQVMVSHAQGKPAPEQLKVSIAYRDGFMSSGMLAIYGNHAAEKARKAGQVLLDRLKRAGFTYARTHIETIGAGDVVPLAPPGSRSAEANEVMLRVTVHDPNKAAVERFTKEFAPLVTAGPPGTTGYTTGRPSVREVFAYWPALINRRAVTPELSWV